MLSSTSAGHSGGDVYILSFTVLSRQFSLFWLFFVPHLTQVLPILYQQLLFLQQNRRRGSHWLQISCHMEWDIGCPVFHSRLCLVSLSHTNQVSHPPTTPSTHSTHPHSIPSNTAIYQSVSAIVFIISVPVLKERVTVLKVRVIITCIMQYVSLTDTVCTGEHWRCVYCRLLLYWQGQLLSSKQHH